MAAPMTEPEARRATERIQDAFREVLSIVNGDIDEPLCGPSPDFRRIGAVQFISIIRDPALGADPDLIYAALASAQWRAAHPEWRKKQVVGHVYFIQDEDGYIKIGFALNVHDRLKSLQTGSRQELRLLASIAGSVQSEHDLHRQFSADRERGEWFRPSSDLLEYIGGVQ